MSLQIFQRRRRPRSFWILGAMIAGVAFFAAKLAGIV